MATVRFERHDDEIPEPSCELVEFAVSEVLERFRPASEEWTVRHCERMPSEPDEATQVPVWQIDFTRNGGETRSIVVDTWGPEPGPRNWYAGGPRRLAASVLQFIRSHWPPVTH